MFLIQCGWEILTLLAFNGEFCALAKTKRD